MPKATSAIRRTPTASKRRYKPDALMYVTAAFLWVSVWRFQDLWPIIGKLQIPMALEILLVLMLLGSMKGARSVRWTKSRIFLSPFIMLAIMIVGIPFSLWLGRSVTFIIRDFVPSLLLMAAVAISLRESEDLDWIAFAHLAGATTYSLWIYLFIPVGSDGRLGELVYYDANDFALLVVSAIPFAIYFLRGSVTLWKRGFALFSLALFVEMIIKSGSRGGFIAFLTVMMYIVVAFRSIPARLRLGALVAGVALMAAFGSTTYWNLMRTVVHPQNDYNMTADNGRKAIWKRGIGYMLMRPVTGVGASAFEQAEGTLSSISRQYAAQGRGLKWSAAHNSFILVGAELGVGGLIVFVTMIGTSFFRLAQIRHDQLGDSMITADDAAFAQMLTASLIGFCVAGFFVSASYFSLLYALIGLVVAEDSLRSRRLVRGFAGPSTPATVRGHAMQRDAQHAPQSHWAPAG